jgi:hypothetical protein
MQDDIATEKRIEALFSLKLDIDQVIARSLPVSPTSYGTLFLTPKKHLYLYIDGQSRLSFGDVKKMVSSMRLIADKFVAPANQDDYFDSIARKRFVEIFPGRHNITEDDLRFYKTLVPYSPALILIKETAGEYIFQFDSDAQSSWRPAVKFSYRRILTS